MKAKTVPLPHQNDLVISTRGSQCLSGAAKGLKEQRERCKKLKGNLWKAEGTLKPFFQTSPNQKKLNLCVLARQAGPSYVSSPCRGRSASDRPSTPNWTNEVGEAEAAEDDACWVSVITSYNQHDVGA